MRGLLRSRRVPESRSAFARETASPQAILEFETERLRLIFGAGFPGAAISLCLCGWYEAFDIRNSLESRYIE